MFSRPSRLWKSLKFLWRPGKSTLRPGNYTCTQRTTNQLKQVVSAPKPASSRLQILSQGTSRCARHFFPLPLLLASSARRQTGERSLEDPRNGGLREKPRSGDKRPCVDWSARLPGNRKLF